LNAYNKYNIVIKNNEVIKIYEHDKIFTENEIENCKDCKIESVNMWEILKMNININKI
jgi:hypothetical protein